MAYFSTRAIFTLYTQHAHNYTNAHLPYNSTILVEIDSKRWNKNHLKIRTEQGEDERWKEKKEQIIIK